MQSGFPTVRKYSRSSTLAFPKTCDYACALERFDSPKMEGIAKVILYTCVITFIAYSGKQLFDLLTITG